MRGTVELCILRIFDVIDPWCVNSIVSILVCMDSSVYEF